MNNEFMHRRTWAEIDLDALAYNYNTIKFATKSKVCCVIKANGYGHGAIELAKLYENLGADYLAVSNIEEALQLRMNKITLPILVLGYTPVVCASLLCQNDIRQCVYSLEYAEKLNAQNYKIKVHIKLDTGMGRIGFSWGQSKDDREEALKACSLSNLITEGVFMHFATADEGEAGRKYVEDQFIKFHEGYRYLEKRGVHFDIHHCANSAAIFDYPEYHLDMVRAGIVLYGLKPSNMVQHLPMLKPAMVLKSVISHIKKIGIGESVGYGRTYLAEKEMIVATVSIGYADGFWRKNGNQKYSVIIKGKQANVLGRVCMDQIMVDVSGISCRCNDEVIIFGNEENSIDKLASINDTIGYEVVCAVGERVPRMYLKAGEIIGWKDNLVR